MDVWLSNQKLTLLIIDNYGMVLKESSHFLEDAFAAGHIAGCRGNNAVRKGTHDYYNEKGLEVISWNNIRSVSRGKLP